MLGSTNDRDQEQSFAMKVEEVKPGEFKATAKSFPTLSKVGQTVKQACARLNQELQTLHRTGKLKR